MTLEDLRMHMTTRAWNVLCAHMKNKTTVPLVLDTDDVLHSLPGAGPAVVRQIHQGITAYEWHTHSHPLCAEP